MNYFELRSQLHAQWLQVKGTAQKQCEQRALNNIAEAYKNCNMFRGNEELRDIVALFKTPQAVEFCTRYHYPNVVALRQFKQLGVERFGVYIDSGSITIDNPKDKIVFIGRTTAVVNCNGKGCYEIVCLHGAKAIINASGWSVVRIDLESGCNVIKNVSENAIIL